MNRTITVVVVVMISTFAARRADAGVDLDCDQIKKGDVAACKKAAVAKCDTIKSYWDKQHCTAKVAAQFDGCIKGNAFRKACEPRIKDYWEICRKAGDLDVNDDESIEAWKRRLLAYDGAMASFAAFDSEWKVCYDHNLHSSDPNTCQRPQDKLRECKDARAAFGKTFADAVDFFLKTGFEQGKQRIADEMKRKDYPAAMRWAEHTSARIELFQKLNQELPKFAHRSADIATAGVDMKKHRAKAAKAFDKVIAKNRCPRGKKHNKRIVTMLRPAVGSFFHSTDDTNVAVKVFRLNGKKKSTHDAKLRETNEEFPGIVCTETSRDGEKMCQSFNLTMRRTKPDGGTWGNWKVYVGSSERLLCKNVR